MKKNLSDSYMYGHFCISLSSCGNSDNEAQSVANVVSTVTISCAGDCTLASDESFSDNTFEDVLKNNKNDYSYFFKNVRHIFEDDDITIVNFEGTLSNNGRDRIRNMRSEENPIM